MLFKVKPYGAIIAKIAEIPFVWAKPLFFVMPHARAKAPKVPVAVSL